MDADTRETVGELWGGKDSSQGKRLLGKAGLVPSQSFRPQKGVKILRSVGLQTLPATQSQGCSSGS